MFLGPAHHPVGGGQKLAALEEMLANTRHVGPEANAELLALMAHVPMHGSLVLSTRRDLLPPGYPHPLVKVAGSGAAQLCEELAAISTLPANDPRLDELG